MIFGRALLGALLCLAAGPVMTQNIRSGSEGLESIDILEGWRQGNGTHIAALEFRLRPGWHTYWRVPGMAGIPPQIDWSASKNLKSVAYIWPKPEVFESYGYLTLGFHDTLVLPVILTPLNAGAPIEASADLIVGVCETICIAAEADVGATLAAEAPARGKPRIERALSRQPLTGGEAGVTDVVCSLQSGPEGYELSTEVTFDAPPPPGQVTVIEVERKGAWIVKDDGGSTRSSVTARAPLAGASGQSAVLERAGTRITILDAERAVDLHGCRNSG